MALHLQKPTPPRAFALCAVDAPSTSPHTGATHWTCPVLACVPRSCSSLRATATDRPPSVFHRSPLLQVALATKTTRGKKVLVPFSLPTGFIMVYFSCLSPSHFVFRKEITPENGCRNRCGRTPHFLRPDLNHHLRPRRNPLQSNATQ